MSHELGKQPPSLEHQLGMLTLEEKLEHHKVNKISFDEAKQKPEFWALTAYTLGRLFVGAFATYLAFQAVESSELALPALLTTASWIADYFDGTYARKHQVCTDLGNFLDHGLADLPMAVNTLAIPIMMFTK
jgi:phosphatidylserine synthase